MMMSINMHLLFQAISVSILATTAFSAYNLDKPTASFVPTATHEMQVFQSMADAASKTLYHASSNKITSSLPTQATSMQETPPPASYKCWKSAMEIVHSADLYISGEDAQLPNSQQGTGYTLSNDQRAARMCADMPEYQHKLLALEVSRCHLHDLGKPLFEEYDDLDFVGSDSDEDTVSPAVQCAQYVIGTEERMYTCLKLLTDTGVVIYTNSISYVQQMCTRMTQELFLDRQMAVQRSTQENHADMVNESLDRLGDWMAASNKHAQAVEELSDLPRKLQEQLDTVQLEMRDKLAEQISDVLPKHMKEQLESHLQPQLSHILNEQVSEHTARAERIWDDWSVRQATERERYEEWVHYQTSLWQQQSRAMERHRETVDHQRTTILNLSDAVKEVVFEMEPFLRLRPFLEQVSNSLSWIYAAMYWIFALDCVFIVSLFSWFKYTRWYSLYIVILSATLEAMLLWVEKDGWINADLRSEVVAMLRKSSWTMQAAVFAIGFVMRIIMPRSGKNVDKVKKPVEHASTQREGGDLSDVHTDSAIHASQYKPATLPVRKQHIDRDIDNGSEDAPVRTSFKPYGYHTAGYDPVEVLFRQHHPPAPPALPPAWHMHGAHRYQNYDTSFQNYSNNSYSHNYSGHNSNLHASRLQRPVPPPPPLSPITVPHRQHEMLSSQQDYNVQDYATSAESPVDKPACDGRVVSVNVHKTTGKRPAVSPDGAIEPPSKFVRTRDANELLEEGNADADDSLHDDADMSNE
jgi:hypothetical protein